MHVAYHGEPCELRMRRENFIEDRGPRPAGADDENTFLDTHWIATNKSVHDLFDISRLLHVINLRQAIASCGKEEIVLAYNFTNVHNQAIRTGQSLIAESSVVVG